MSENNNNVNNVDEVTPVGFDDTKEPIDSIEKTVEDLKKKIQEIEEKEDEKEETKSFISDEQKEKLEEIKENIKNTANKAVQNEDVQKTVDFIKANAIKAYDLAKDKITEVSKNEKVQEYAERGTEAINKAGKYINDNIPENAKEGLDSFSKQVVAGAKKVASDANEYVNRPDVQEKIQKVKDSTLDAAAKSTDAIKKFFNKDSKDSEE